MFCDIEDVLRRAVPRRSALRAEAQPRAGPGEGLHVLRRARDGVLLLPRPASEAEALDSRRLLRPHRARPRFAAAQADGAAARGDGHPGRVLVPRERPEPARDRPALHRRADDGRQRDDVPAHHQGGRARPRRATRRSCRSRSPARSAPGCTRTSRCSRATSTRSTIPATSTACRRSRSTSSPGLLVHADEICRDHEPVGQLVQAADPRLRSAGLQVLGAQQPLGARARAAAEAGQERVDAASSSARPIPRATRTSRSR